MICEQYASNNIDTLLSKYNNKLKEQIFKILYLQILNFKLYMKF